MSKPIHIRDTEVIRAIEEGADGLVIGQRRFLLVEVDEATGEPHLVKDPEEAALVRDALNDTSPRLSGEAARDYLKARLREHGIRLLAAVETYFHRWDPSQPPGFVPGRPVEFDDGPTDLRMSTVTVRSKPFRIYFRYLAISQSFEVLRVLHPNAR